MKFRESFRESCLLAIDRVKLAREGRIPGDSFFESYIKRKKEFDLRKEISFLECVSSVLGWAWGNYTSFCPTQYQLDRFDEMSDLYL